MKSPASHYAVFLIAAAIIFGSAHTWWVFSGNGSPAAVLQSLPKPTSPQPPIPLPVEYRENSSAYSFINPLLFIETDQRLYPEFDNLDAQINQYIQIAKSSSHLATAVSVYVRDLNKGSWTGVNESEKYEPSSMLKVAVMIAYIRQAMSEAAATNTTTKDQLAKTLYYPGADETGQYYTASSHLSPGYYPIQTLINEMIINSDNMALNVLLSQDTPEYDQVYQDFRLPSSPEGNPTDFMTAKSYSTIFRTLYNSTYISWRYSEQALKLLASTTFDAGIVAGVPAGTVVAHKFGEHTYTLVDGTPISRELHDCGIVYYPGRPYLVCIMTKGSDFPSLAKVISGVSGIVYSYMSTATTTPAK